MNKVPDSVRKELAALAAKPESEIDFSDLPATQRKDWQGAQRQVIPAHPTTADRAGRCRRAGMA
jgi:hypothetical protein